MIGAAPVLTSGDPPRPDDLMLWIGGILLSAMVGAFIAQDVPALIARWRDRRSKD